MSWGTWLVASLVVGPLLLIGVNRATRRWMRPAWAAWGLLGGILAIAGATLCAVAVLAWTLFARIPLAASLGQWSTDRVDQATRIPLGVSGLAAAAGILILANLIRVGATEVSGRRETRDALAAISAVDVGADLMVVIDDEVPFAHSTSSGRPRIQRILVSTGMVDALRPGELDSVLAHERSHLRHRHGWFRTSSELAVAINPLLRWSAGDLRFALESWADEDAGVATDRDEVARALQHAALARLAFGPTPSAGAFEFGGFGVRDRVGALLRSPRRGRWVGSAAYLLVLVLVLGGALRALERSEDLLEALQNLR